MSNKISKRIREQLYYESGNICALCGVIMTDDWNKETSRTINRLVPGDNGGLIVACARCIWTKNKLGSDVYKYIVSTDDLTLIRRVVNDFRRAGGFPWNKEYATPLEQLQQLQGAQGASGASLQQPGYVLPPTIKPIEVVNAVSTPSMEPVDSIKKDLSVWEIQQRQREAREKAVVSLDAKYGKAKNQEELTEEELKQITERRPERPKVVGGLSALLDGVDD